MTTPSRVAPDAPAIYRPPIVLNTHIGMLAPFVLHRRCTCPNGYWSSTVIWKLVERYGGHRLLGDILPRLICAHCRKPPTVILAESYHLEFCGGPPPGWSVVLSEGGVERSRG